MSKVVSRTRPKTAMAAKATSGKAATRVPKAVVKKAVKKIAAHRPFAAAGLTSGVQMSASDAQFLETLRKLNKKRAGEIAERAGIVTKNGKLSPVFK